MKYTIISSKGTPVKTTQKLITEVNRMMEQGWKPTGGVAVTEAKAYQAMTYQPAPKPPKQG